MTILCTPYPPSDPLLAAVGERVVVAADLPGVDGLLSRDPSERLVVIGPDVDLKDVADFATRQRLLRPAVGVILIRHELDVDTYAQSMKAGVRELVAPDDLNSLAEACRRSLLMSDSVTSPGPALPAGKVVTIFGTKGGCGKTTLATNLAVSLHAPGARRVCLVDLDLAFGDVAISLQLEPRRTLVDAVSMGENLDATGVSGLLTAFRPGLDCVLAPVEPGDAEKMPAALVEDLLMVLRGMFDYVVVDTPPQFNEHVLKALDCSDQHVLLTTPDMPALKNLRLTLDMLDLLSYPRSARSIVLNREDPRVGITAEDVEQVLRTEIDARIPASIDVPASVNRGVPIATEKPSHRVSASIREFSTHRVVGVPATAKRHRRRRLWDRAANATRA